MAIWGCVGASNRNNRQICLTFVALELVFCSPTVCLDEGHHNGNFFPHDITLNGWELLAPPLPASMYRLRLPAFLGLDILLLFNSIQLHYVAIFGRVMVLAVFFGVSLYELTMLY